MSADGNARAHYKRICDAPLRFHYTVKEDYYYEKKLIAVLMCAAMVTVLGAGCGSKKEDTKETSDTKKEYTEDELKDSMKGVKLKVGTTGLSAAIYIL